MRACTAVLQAARLHNSPGMGLLATLAAMSAPVLWLGTGLAVDVEAEAQFLDNARSLAANWSSKEGAALAQFQLAGAFDSALSAAELQQLPLVMQLTYASRGVEVAGTTQRRCLACGEEAARQLVMLAPGNAAYLDQRAFWRCWGGMPRLQQ